MKKSDKNIDFSFKEAKKTLRDLLGGTRIEGCHQKNSDVKIKARFLPGRQEKILIEKENCRLSEKIGNVRASFSVKAWKKDYDRSRKYLMIKQKSSRPTSRISQKRNLIDTVNITPLLCI
jgi:hypothetical protein